MALEPTTVTAGSFTVAQAAQSLSMSVSSAPPWYTNESYVIYVSYSSNQSAPTVYTTGFSPTVIVSYANGQSQTLVASATMQVGPWGSQGSAAISWTPLWNYQASLYATYGGVSSNTATGQVYAPTTFTGVSVSPTVVSPGASVSVVAMLEYYVNGSWNALPNATVTYAVTGPSGTVAQGTAVTGSNGEVSIALQAPTQPGSYTVTLAFSPSSFDGSLGSLLPSSVSIALQVGQEVSSATSFLSKYGKWILVGVAVAAAAGIVLYEYSRHHRSS